MNGILIKKYVSFWNKLSNYFAKLVLTWYYDIFLWTPMSYIVGPIAKLCMCQFGPVKIQGYPKRGNSWKFNPPPFPHLRYAVVSLFSTKNFLQTNRMHDLKGCMKKCCCFRCHFELNILKRFGISSVVLGHYVHILHIMGTTNLIG